MFEFLELWDIDLQTMTARIKLFDEDFVTYNPFAKPEFLGATEAGGPSCQTASARRNMRRSGHRLRPKKAEP